MSKIRTRIYKTDGIILKQIPFLEKDRIITIYSQEYGKLRLIAKGIRSPKSKFGGSLTSGGFDLDGWLNKDFSMTLNSYSRLVGNTIGIEINHFSDLTEWANKYYKTNVRAEEWAQNRESA